MANKPRKSPWSERLQRWGDAYGDLYRDAIVELAQMSFDEIVEFKSEIQRLGQSNCSWWMYHAGRDLLLTAMPVQMEDDSDLEHLRRNALDVLRERGIDESDDTYQAVMRRNGLMTESGGVIVATDVLFP